MKTIEAAQTVEENAFLLQIKKDISEQYAIYRGQVEHENGLYNQRINWMILIHGILFATFGFMVQALTSIDAQLLNAANLTKFTLYALMVVNVLGVWIAIIGVQIQKNSRDTLKWLKNDWNNLAKDFRSESVTLHPSGAGGREASIPIIRSAHLSLSFAIAWLVLLALCVSMLINA